MAVASPSKAVSALRTYQTEYPDYDAETWIASVRGVFHVKSVLTVALGLATLSDWSLRGIEISQDRLAKMTGVSKRSVTKAVARLTEAGFLSVSRRYPRSNGHEVTQKPDAYRLVIPGGPTWGVANTGLIGWDDEASYSVDTFSQETSPLHSRGPTYKDDGLFLWERRYIPEVTEELPTPFSWQWDETDWITSPKGHEASYSVDTFSQESLAA